MAAKTIIKPFLLLLRADKFLLLFIKISVKPGIKILFPDVVWKLITIFSMKINSYAGGKLSPTRLLPGMWL